MAAAAVQYSYLFLGTAISALRLFGIQLPINLVGLLVVGLTALLAVPSWNLYGAAVAVLAGQLIRALLYWVVLAVRMRPLLAERAADGCGVPPAAVLPGRERSSSTRTPERLATGVGDVPPGT
jgi:hypothetical protein